MAQRYQRRFLGYGLSGLAAALLLAVGYSFVCLKIRQQIARGVVARAAQSVGLRKKLGEPVKAGYFVRGRVIGGDDSGNADLAIPVSGPKGSGQLIDWSQNGFAGWQVCSLQFRSGDGSTLVIVPDETSTCERE